MKILFDLEATQPNSLVKRHGGGVYGEIVFRRMVERGKQVAAYYDSGKWFNPEIKGIIESYGIELLDCRGLSLQQVVEQSGASRLYSPLPTIAMTRLQGCEVMGTIHGLRNLETPRDWGFFGYRHRVKDYVRFMASVIVPSIVYRKRRAFYDRLWLHKGVGIVTVSNHSAYSFATYFPAIDRDRIKVYYSPSTTRQGVPEGGCPCSGKYFLLVSADRWEKNNLRAIKALDRLFGQGRLEGYKVKVTGVADASAFRYRIKNSGRFEFLGYVDDDTLDRLFQQAWAFVYPSLNEGFGYPPLQAMYHGVPVIASPFTSIPEVCGNAALYFNPYSIEEIMNRMLQVCDLSIREELVANGRKQYASVTARQERDLDALVDYISK